LGSVIGGKGRHRPHASRNEDPQRADTPSCTFRQSSRSPPYFGSNVSSGARERPERAADYDRPQFAHIDTHDYMA